MNILKAAISAVIFGCVCYEFTWWLVQIVVVKADDYFWLAQKFLCVILGLFGTFMFYLILRKDQ